MSGDRTRALLAFEIPFGGTLDDVAVEWRRMFAEWLGTFILVLVAAGAVVVNQASGGQVSLASRVVAPGVVVMGLIYASGAIGGAHLNPAVTLCFATRGNFPWIRVPGYIVAQLSGALCAAGVLRLVFGNIAALGATLPGPQFSNRQAFAIEALLTFVLCTIILGTASGAKNIGANAALAVGGYVAAAGLWAAPVSGASMNPARSLGPVVVSGEWHAWWIYLVGPVLAGQVAAISARALRGPHSAAGDRAAQGDLAPSR